MKKTLLLALVIGTLTFLDGNRSLLAWGQDGHRITAEIAERNLNPAAHAAIRELLGEETLAELSTWGDEIRSDGTWDFAKPWHYISIDDEETWEDFERVPEDEGDVLVILDKLDAFLSDSKAKTLTLSGAMKGGSSKLKIAQTKEIDKREALALYIHFVGDIHQPLHVGRREDQGGNRIQVEFFGEETTLHKVWDEALIESTHLSYTEFATFLNRVSEKDKKEWSDASYLDWAKESKEIRDQVYDFGAQRKGYYLNIVTAPVLSYDYRTKTLPLVKQRLTQAGIRLAAKLNTFFGAD